MKMTMFKRYLRYHLKESLRPMICILVAVFALTFLIGFNETSTLTYELVDFELQEVRYYRSTLTIPVIFLSVLVSVIPVIEFSFFKKRINLDCIYALPISRRTMGLVHYVTGAITLLGSFTLSYLLNFLFILKRGVENFENLPSLIVHYLLCAVIGAAVYTVLVFVFNEANTMGDGIWFMILWSLAMALVLISVAELLDGTLDTNPLGNAAYTATPYGLLVTSLTGGYESFVETNPNSAATFWSQADGVAFMIVWTVLGIAAAFGLYFTFGKRKVEKTEEISDSFFGYRVMIPLYAVTGMIALSASEIVAMWVIIEAIAILGYTIYRRGFHYKKSDIIVLLSLIIFLFVKL